MTIFPPEVHFLNKSGHNWSLLPILLFDDPCVPRFSSLGLNMEQSFYTTPSHFVGQEKV